jgi:hypothetical protein
MALAEIAADEEEHLRFHCAFFRTETRTRWRKVLFLVGFRLVGWAACTLMLLDHRPSLRALGVTWDESHRRLRALMATVEAHTLGPEPAAADAEAA